ncbi:MAG: c-type cytochrome [Candidatus Eisenbacteria bacterium]|nr:c-type cytochrome [Candidatus Eisenbacteria bacterium]
MKPQTLFRSLKAVLILLPVVALAQLPPPPIGPLPNLPVPAANPITAAKANLGKVLFWDEQLSSSRTVACGTCHRAEAGGGDPRPVRGVAAFTNAGPDGTLGTPDDITGSPGVPQANSDGSYASAPVAGLAPQVTGRGTPSHINAGFAPNTFWDGRATAAFLDPVTGDTLIRVNGGLESQVVGPPLSSVEMGHIGRDWPAVVARIQASQPLALAAFIPADLKNWIDGRTYPQLFQEAFGTTAITPGRIAFAIATYERTLLSNQAKIDSVIAGTATLTPQQAQGQQLFGTLGCAGCHAGALFSDNNFHYIGVRPAAEDSGRFEVTRNIGNIAQMKTPSLRNVGLRTNYFHVGRFNRLEDVVAFYNRGGDFNAPNKPPVIRPLGLSPGQQAALVAFLREALTDNRVRDRVFPFDRPSLYSEAEMVPQITGAGVPGSGGAVPEAIALEPALAGNPAFTVGVQHAVGGGTAVLVIDAAEPPADVVIPASASFARVEVPLQGLGAGQGFGSATLAIPGGSALVGQKLHGRWYVNDPSASGGVAWSPAFSFTVFGPNANGLLAVDPPAPTLPRALQLSPGRPTPFRSSTLIQYEIYQASPVRLTVFDAQGRSVRRLVEGATQMPGAYAVTWDGRDDGGRLSAAGVYFYRLESGGRASTLRTVKLD